MTTETTLNQCARCTVPPAQPAQGGTLCLAPPLTETVAKLRDLLHRSETPYTEPYPNLLAIALAPGLILRLADGISAILTPAEIRDTRSAIAADVAKLGLADLVSMQPLATLFALIRSEWFTEMLRDGRLTTHFQPIVHADDPGVVFAHECLLRGLAPDGQIVAPGHLYQTARDADLLSSLDRAARLTAIRNAAMLGLDLGAEHLFINFNPTSIYDPVHCLSSTVAAVADTALRPERVVFEVVESDKMDDVEHLVRIVDYYRSAGFKVALDDLGSGYGSLKLLSRLKPDFVKLDIELIRGVDHDAYKAAIVGTIFEMARKLGVATVAEGIETEAELAWVRDHGADYAQGFFIARPGSPPPRPRGGAASRGQAIAADCRSRAPLAADAERGVG